MTGREVRAYLRTVDPALIRTRADIPLRSIAAALGVEPCTAWKWETHRTVPAGPRGPRYCRIIAGLARHAEIPETGGPE